VDSGGTIAFVGGGKYFLCYSISKSSIHSYSDTASLHTEIEVVQKKF
jgi:hypothetical protein